MKKMKKKILGGIAVFVIAVVAAWNVNLNSQKSDLSDISLANVEALASETGNNSNVCYNTITTSDTHQIRYCGTCTFIPGDNTWTSGKGTC
jgi:uncharacterized Rmd1/YagE family protein